MYTVLHLQCLIEVRQEQRSEVATPSWLDQSVGRTSALPRANNLSVKFLLVLSQDTNGIRKQSSSLAMHPRHSVA